jgi:beta-lactamase regulating signal transducer with metallopeptidase domain
MSETLLTLVPTLVSVLGRALLHFLWQGALIGLVAALLLHALRDARPHARYAVACLALLACALAPLLDIAWQLADARHMAPNMVAAPAIALMPTLGDATHALARAWRLDDALPMIVAVWASGACALSLRMALGVWWIQRLCSAPQGAAAATWQARLDALAPRFGLRRPVALRLVDAIASPASVGWWRPVVLLPTALLARMPVDLVEALLAHELAHIRRHDYLVNLLQGAVEAMLFYHPVTWWLTRRIRVEREEVADLLAAEAIGEPRRLAVALSELSGSLASTEALPSLVLAADGGHLMSRIEQLIRPSLRRTRGGRIAFPLLGFAVACVALLAHAQAGRVATDKPMASNAPPASEVREERNIHRNDRDDAESHDTRRITYAIVRKDRKGITMSGDTRDVPAIVAMRHEMDGDFLWFRKENRDWVVVDPAILDRAERAWAATEPLDRQMEGLDAKMDVYDRRMEALDAQMEKLSALQDDHPGMDAATERMEALGRQQEFLASKQEKLAEAMARVDDVQREQLSSQMETLSGQQESLSQLMEAQSRVIDSESARMDRHAQPMEALGKQMEEAGKPMEALSKQIDVVDAQMDRISQQAERETLQLIDEAIAKGLAQPAPTRR